MSGDETYGSVRYIVQDVQASIDFYVNRLGFTLRAHPAPPFADVTRGSLRVLLSGPGSSGARATPADLDVPGRNRIHVIVDDLALEVERLRAGGVEPTTDIVGGPGGQQVLVADPDGNLVELFQPR
ncbi:MULTISPECIES: VOC family protein [Aeromicrobium]|uniref:VOC family protein n=1 Tax=Aeromicrobium TaxID=2040 RepID=UPI00257BE9F6|nr:MULTISPECIES: VOC family protein [Aeromicrobium]